MTVECGNSLCVTLLPSRHDSVSMCKIFTVHEHLEQLSVMLVADMPAIHKHMHPNDKQCPVLPASFTVFPDAKDVAKADTVASPPQHVWHITRCYRQSIRLTHTSERVSQGSELQAQSISRSFQRNRDGRFCHAQEHRSIVNVALKCISVVAELILLS